MKNDTSYVLLWEYKVRKGFEGDFESAYGPHGSWARLFASAQGFLGTELLRDPVVPRRYLTIDRWASADAFTRFRESHRLEYATLDTHCEPWCETETALGSWTVARPT